MSLRRTHPNFWLVVVGDVIGLGWIGAALTFVNNTSTTWRYIEALAPLEVFGVLFLASAALLVYGLARQPALFRLGLAAGAALCSLFAFGLTEAILADLIDRGDTPGAAAPGLFTMAAVQLVAQAREPRSNPDAARRH